MPRRHTTKGPKSNGKSSGFTTSNKLILFGCLPAAIALVIGWSYAKLYTTGLLSFASGFLFSNEKPILYVVDIPGKGKGAIAARDIKQGELIIREDPLLLLPSGTPAADLPKLIGKFDNNSRSAFKSLSYVSLPDHVDVNPSTQKDSDVQAEAIAILTANSVAVGDGLNTIGLYPRMARLNHACAGASTASYSWRERSQLLVHAIKPIKRGEEITLSYYDCRMPRTERRERLSKQYGFNCSCSVCSLSDKESEESDRRLTDLVSLENDLKKDISGREAGAIARKIWKLSEEEHYFHRRGFLADQFAKVAARHSDEHAVRQWSQLSVKWYAIELGKDNVRVARMRKYIHNPRDHSEWGRGPEDVVGGPKLT